MEPTAARIASSARTTLRTLGPSQLLLCSVAIGLAGGLLATIYYFLLQGLLSGIWLRLLHTNPLSLSIEPHLSLGILLVTSFGGFFVGLLTRWLGSAGEIAAVVDNIHLQHGRIDMRQTPAMTATSLVSIAAGGSAGPEAPLVQIIGSFGSWLGDRLNLSGSAVRTFTFCGMGAALGAFFGAPLGGALFALEIPHRRGIEYYEALLPALVASLAAFLLFRSLIGYKAILFHLPGEVPLSISGVLWGIVFGSVGALVATLFAVVFVGVGRITHGLRHSPVILGTLGGITIGLLAQVAPKSLFWGELQIDAILHSPAELWLSHTSSRLIWLLLLLAAAKILAVSATLHSGFRGGFIFPLMFIGACVGTAISVAFPSVPAPIAIIATMASVNVAITKTPVSTSVLLVTLTGSNLMPVVIAASVTSLLLSSRLNLIHTQRSRFGTMAEISPMNVIEASTIAVTTEAE